MAKVSYLYFEHPSKDQLTSLFSAIERVGYVWSHLGPDDPPKKFVGKIDETISRLCDGPDSINYAFARIANGDASLTFMIGKDQESWPHSTLSVSGETLELVDHIVELGLKSLSIYLAIEGRTDRGKNQRWTVIEKSSRCPDSLLERTGLKQVPH